MITRCLNLKYWLVLEDLVLQVVQKSCSRAIKWSVSKKQEGIKDKNYIEEILQKTKHQFDCHKILHIYI